MIVSSFCFVLKCVHVTSYYLSARVHGHRVRGCYCRRAQVVARLLPLASSLARVMPSSTYSLALAGPYWLWPGFRCYVCVVLGWLAMMPRIG